MAWPEYPQREARDAGEAFRERRAARAEDGSEMRQPVGAGWAQGATAWRRPLPELQRLARPQLAWAGWLRRALVQDEDSQLQLRKLRAPLPAAAPAQSLPAGLFARLRQLPRLRRPPGRHRRHFLHNEL